jgi:hypothetical protein
VLLLHCLIQLEDVPPQLLLQPSQGKLHLLEAGQVLAVFGEILLDYLVNFSVI